MEKQKKVKFTPTSFMVIPDDCLFEVSEYLPAFDLVNVMLVSKMCYRVFDNEIQYKLRYENLLKSETKYANCEIIWDQYKPKEAPNSIFIAENYSFKFLDRPMLFTLYPRVEKEITKFIEKREFKKAYLYLSKYICCSVCKEYAIPDCESFMLGENIYPGLSNIPLWMNKALIYSLDRWGREITPFYWNDSKPNEYASDDDVYYEPYSDPSFIGIKPFPPHDESVIIDPQFFTDHPLKSNNCKSCKERVHRNSCYSKHYEVMLCKRK